MQTPEQLAEGWVTGEGNGVVLGGVVAPPVKLIEHPNPALARDELTAIRRFVAAAVREALRLAGVPTAPAGVGGGHGK